MTRFERLSSGRVAVFSPGGDFAFLGGTQFEMLAAGLDKLVGWGQRDLAELYAKHLVTGPSNVGMSRLFQARRAAHKETVTSGVSLHIIVPTLQCACETIFESKSFF